MAERFDLRHPLLYDAANGRHRTASELASELTLSAPSDDARLFYECIKKARAAYVSVAAIRALSERAFAEAVEDSPDGLEMRVSLFSMTRTLFENERVDWAAATPIAFAERCREVLLAIIAARDESEARTGTRLLLRLGFSRTFESEPHYRAMAAVVREHASALCGLDVLGIVTGDDREPLPAALEEILRSLRGALPDLSIHAGEFEGAGSVERTLALEPQAIGHGVHSVQRTETMKRLRDQGVTLEVCPTSNRLLIPTALGRLSAGCGAHPLVSLQRSQVHCVLGSDDPTPMGTDFRTEWMVAEALGVDLGQLSADIARRWGQLTRG